jgi:hypothetical protein
VEDRNTAAATTATNARMVQHRWRLNRDTTATMLLSSFRVARRMSTTAKVWVDRNTKVICQGFTGKQVRRQRCARRGAGRPSQWRGGGGGGVVLARALQRGVPVPAEQHNMAPVSWPWGGATARC